MDAETKKVLLEVAGFLILLANGTILVPPHARSEAESLLKKIGQIVTS